MTHAAGKAAAAGGKIPGPDREKGPADLYRPKRCVSVREPYSAERRKAASERAKAAGYRPPVKKAGVE